MAEQCVEVGQQCVARPDRIAYPRRCRLPEQPRLSPCRLQVCVALQHSGCTAAWTDFLSDDRIAGPESVFIRILPFQVITAAMFCHMSRCKAADRRRPTAGKEFAR